MANVNVAAARDVVRRPNFLYIGPSKAGSTWLFESLRHHPNVFLASAKDLYYFDRYYFRGEAWYLRHFRNAGEAHEIIGEISHDYLYSAEACRRIAADLPNVVLMTILREPVERAFSEYLYLWKQGAVGSNFAAATAERPEIIEHSRYAKYMRPYLATFGRERILAAVFDDLNKSPVDFFKQVCRYLSIDTESPLQLPAGRVLQATSPRSFTAARISKFAAVSLRNLGFASFVGQLKQNSIIQRALYRHVARSELPQLDEETHRRYKEFFRPDLLELDARFGYELCRQWGYE